MNPPLVNHPDVAGNLRLLEAWVESQVAYRELPGMALGIVHDQDLLWARGFGFADVAAKTPATPDTIYRIASISKLFTATAVMQLRDAGRLRLDDPVEQHLPEFRLRRDPALPPVTVRQLLTHTAGLPREAASPYWTTAEFPTREAVLATLAAQETVYPPDTRWKYSNLALTLAGQIVENVSGKPYATYVEREILAPLGMESTSVGVPKERRGRLATGYGRLLPGAPIDGSPRRALRPFTDAKGIDPAAGIASTVADLARFAMLQFRADPALPAGGRQILRGSTLAEMHRVHWLEPDWKSGSGIGFKVIHREEGDLVGHGGWVAGYQTAFQTCPSRKVAVICLTNADDGQPYPGAPSSPVDRAFRWVAPAIARAAAPPAAAAPPDPGWERYVGRYRSPWRDAQVLVYGDRLVVIGPNEADPLATMATLVPVREHAFRLDGGDPSGSHGELAVFELGPDGRAVRLRTGPNWSDRIMDE